MQSQLLAKHIGIPVENVQTLLAQESSEIFANEDYLNLIRRLDLPRLEATLPDVRALYEERLPAFKEKLAAQFEMDTQPMSAYTLGTWLIGVARYPETAGKIVEMHENVPGDVVEKALPDLLAILDTLPSETRKLWQGAMCVMCLPMIRL